jgi:serine O-acetyltransferase
MLKEIVQDFKAIKQNDPAAKNWVETLLCHTPFHAILMYRIAHALHGLGLPVIPRFITVLGRFWAGVEIHPGAKVGSYFFIDHGTGVVIGETAEIGNHCVLFHGVTLGGTGHFTGKRHPTIGDYVLIGTSATLLGPIRVGNNVMVGAETVIINRDVPDNCTVVGAPGVIVKRDGMKVHEKLPLPRYYAQNSGSGGAGAEEQNPGE